MPRNAPGVVNLGVWMETRLWFISIGLPRDMKALDIAELASSWAKQRSEQDRCFLVSQVSEQFVALPHAVVPAVAISGEVSPDRATWCSDESVQRLLYRLALRLLEETKQDQAWIRYKGNSVAVNQDWLRNQLSNEA